MPSWENKKAAANFLTTAYLWELLESNQPSVNAVKKEAVSKVPLTAENAKQAQRTQS
jgi:hypothetical protein